MSRFLRPRFKKEVIIVFEEDNGQTWFWAGSIAKALGCSRENIHYHARTNPEKRRLIAYRADSKKLFLFINTDGLRNILARTRSSASHELDAWLGKFLNHRVNARWKRIAGKDLSTSWRICAPPEFTPERPSALVQIINRVKSLFGRSVA